MFEINPRHMNHVAAVIHGAAVPRFGLALATEQADRGWILLHLFSPSWDIGPINLTSINKIDKTVLHGSLRKGSNSRKGDRYSPS
jgi:hypothetical protein